MKFTKLATAAASVALAVGLSACGSSTKTADVQSSGPALVGVTMPTKSSERWIADGDNVKAALEKLGYKVDLQYAENDIPTQVNQIENMITKGAKVLIIASIDGTALADALQEAADKKHPGHRLRPADPRVAERRLLRHLRQLQGGRAAGDLAAGRPGPEEAGRLGGHRHRPVQRRAVRRFAGRQQRHLLLQRRDVRPAAVHRQRHAGRQERSDRLQDRSPSCAGTRRPRRSAWTTSSPRRTPAARGSHGRPVALRRPVHRHPRRR